MLLKTTQQKKLEETIMTRNHKLLIILTVAMGTLLLIPTAANASTVNYGALARSSQNDHINFKFRFNKRLSHVSDKLHEALGSVAVYDTKIQNGSEYNVKFYFSKLWFANLSGYRLYDRPVFQPTKSVVVKAHSTKVVNNSFRDTLDASYSYFVPQKKKQFVIQYFKNNKYYLGKVNDLHHKLSKVGWNPTWKWAN
jgi:hypothetical protein